MTDESFMTEADIICKELEEARAELAEKDILIKQLQQELAALKGK